MSSGELTQHRDRRRTRYAAVAVAALGVASCLSLLLGPASPARAPARLKVLAAAVELRSPGETSFGTVSSPTGLDAGSVVRTGNTGLAEIGFGDGSLTRVGPDTTYSLTTLQIGPDTRQIVGRLDMGRTFHRVSKVTGSQSRFEVHTSKAVAAVRGTAFSVQCLTIDTCEIAVTEGTVAVITPDGASVDVTAGRRIVVGASGAVGEIEATPPSDPWIEMNRGPEQETTAPPTSRPTGTDSSEAAETSSNTTGPAPASSSETTSTPVNATTSVPRLPSPPRPTGTSIPSSGGSSPTTTSPLGPDVEELPPTTIPAADPSVICPGHKGDPERIGPGKLDDDLTDCLPCEVGETVLHNPSCEEGGD